MILTGVPDAVSTQEEKLSGGKKNMRRRGEPDKGYSPRWSERLSRLLITTLEQRLPAWKLGKSIK